jgi:hypothetical protein
MMYTALATHTDAISFMGIEIRIIMLAHLEEPGTM